MNCDRRTIVIKKILSVILLIASLGALAGCTANEPQNNEELAVYSFCGENEQFTVSNGVIVVGNEEEVFYGGDLEVKQEEFFENVVSFSTTFYTLQEAEKRTILSNSVTDMTNGSIKVSGNLGKMSGADILIGNKVKNLEELRDNLYFELSTTDAEGENSTYQIQLVVTNVTE